MSWLRDDKFAAAILKMLGWTLLAWAALRLPNGAVTFIFVITLFLIIHVILPGLKAIWHWPARTAPNLPPPEADPTPVVTALLIGLCLLGGALNSHASVVAANLPDSVTQQIHVEDQLPLVPPRSIGAPKKAIACRSCSSPRS